MQIKDLKLVMAEKFSFESKNENEKGKLIEGYFLTFVDNFHEKVVISAGKPFDEFEGKWVNAEIDLSYREFQGKKGFKLKVDNLTATKTPDFAQK